MELDATVEALAPRLLRYCLGRTGSAEAAEEVAQDALAALVGRWRRHGPPESPEAFAFAVARRRAWRLAVRRRLHLPLSALSDGRDADAQAGASLGEGPAAELDLEARTLVRAEVARALAALRRLPDRDREAILLVSAAELRTVCRIERCRWELLEEAEEAVLVFAPAR